MHTKVVDEDTREHILLGAAGEPVAASGVEIESQKMVVDDSGRDVLVDRHGDPIAVLTKGQKVIANKMGQQMLVDETGVLRLSGVVGPQSHSANECVGSILGCNLRFKCTVKFPRLQSVVTFVSNNKVVGIC